MGRKKTHGEFCKQVFDLTNGEYIVLGKYINNNDKILMLHLKCGNVYYVSPKNFTNIGRRCPVCNGGTSKNTTQFKQEVYNLVGNEYTVLGDYVNNKTKIKMKHNNCEYIYEVTPNGFIHDNTRCPKCSGLTKKNTTQFKQEVYNLVGNEYTVLGDYVNSQTKTKMKHNNCGHIYEVTPNNFTSKGRRCPKCNGTHKKTTASFSNEVNLITNGEYTVVGTYVNNKTKIDMKHNKCGNIYKVTPTRFISGTRCPICCNGKHWSNGEMEVREYIESLVECYSKEYSKGILEVKDKNGKIISKQDIDILTVGYLGFEYNGERYHEEAENPTGMQKPIGYHKEKIRLAKNKGITLYHIWERDWKKRPEAVKEFIRKAIEKY